MKKRYFFVPVPFVMLFINYLLYEQEKLLPADIAGSNAVRSIIIISVIGTAVVFLLLTGGFVVLYREKHLRDKTEYTDEIVRKFFVPVNGILGLSEQLLKKNMLKGREAEELRLINKSADRMKRTLTDIEEYYALVNRETKLQFTTVSLKELADIVLRYIDEKNSNTDIHIVNHISEDIYIYADPMKIQQVLSNIVIILIDFTTKGTITLSADITGKRVEVLVYDDGVVVEEHIKKIVFKPFEGANNISNLHYQGTGFSLAIAYYLIKMHKGRIWIDKELKDAAALHFTLKKAKYKINGSFSQYKRFQDFRNPGNTAVSMKHEGETKGKLLFIKTDSIHKQILMSYMYEDGYDVEAPDTGSLQLNCMNLNQEFDLIIIDELFEYSSFDLCRQIRNRFGLTQLPVLLLVPNDRQANLNRAYAAGANDCIDYLVMEKQLLAKIQTLVTIKRATDELMQAQVKYLQAQIQPHFLYNALNVITGLCMEDPARAHDVLLSFSQYLRAKFNFKSTVRGITINEELNTVKAYLNVEKARFGERFSYSVTLKGTGERLIPALIIQPLVENAVKHGAGRLSKGGMIEVHIEESLTDTYVIVKDNGQGMPLKMVMDLRSGKAGQYGTGISNVWERLQLFHCNDITINSEVYKGTEITFRLPVMAETADR